MCREALSARIDGERSPVPAEQVDRHLADCADCTAWHAGAVALSRSLRMRPVVETPDLTASILARAEAEARPAVRAHRMRRALLVLREAFGLGRTAPRTSEPVTAPPGGRLGRRRNHLRGQDPAA